ncbi:phage terminase large subunit-like protein [Paraburkholderia sp. BL8N3]|nr:terminase TerL endonuclease subunit [Paraburkholderia sp. BL8N3]TCK37981.1 phage terminase large subunit-like protein [Paraburkholderia sp. BL8N3]
MATNKTPRKRTSKPGEPVADPATQYAADVTAGLIVAGPDVRAACARHLDDLKHGVHRGIVWNLEAAVRAIKFFPDVLCLNGGEFEGVPFHLLPWQAFIVGSLFGWKREDGSRRFREAYIESGKGSGKSPLAGGIGLYMLMADNEERAEVYAAATKREQAQILFRDAVAMVDLSPALSRRILKSGRGERTFNLAYMAKGSFFRTIASDSSGQSGPRPHCALIDEVHEHRDRTVIDMMQAGKKGRRQPLIFMITNSGFDRTSLCFEKHEYGQKVGGQKLQDDAFFAYICGLDEDEDPFEDEACWIKANPSLGQTIQRSYLEEQVRQARGMPSLESTVRRLNFCQWVDAANPWIDGDLWRACEDNTLSLADFTDADIYGGLDLSGTRDLTAFAGARRNPDDSCDAFVQFFTPQDTMDERDRKEKTHFVEWSRDGHVISTPGRSIDYQRVVIRLQELMALMNLLGMAYDPYRIKYMERELDNAGVMLPLIPHGQGYVKSTESGLWMPRSVELMERLVLTGKLRVVFNPCLRWNSASAVIEADAKNNRIFTKRKSTGRIDGLVALCMAIGYAFNEAEVENLDDFINAPLIA